MNQAAICIAVSSVQVQDGDLVSGLTMYRLDEESPFMQRAICRRNDP